MAGNIVEVYLWVTESVSCNLKETRDHMSTVLKISVGCLEEGTDWSHSLILLLTLLVLILRKLPLFPAPLTGCVYFPDDSNFLMVTAVQEPCVLQHF